MASISKSLYKYSILKTGGEKQPIDSYRRQFVGSVLNHGILRTATLCRRTPAEWVGQSALQSHDVIMAGCGTPSRVMRAHYVR